ncbi:MAG: EF-P lysine aminoacylase GenX [Verrucomicrobiota bacterium]|nr:EF-P lysine aminoacylase GenX [Verrucomicrobiota bacterium]
MINLSILKDRAAMLAKARQFFAQRNILEVDCSALSPHAAIDSNIDVIPAQVTPRETGFLHTSPEYAMKRLLSAGSGDIYYLGHVFRQGEIGRLHNPEFTMAEWYRIGLSFDQMIQETCDFISLFLGPLPIRHLSYRQAFEQYVGVDYAKDPLLDAASRYSASPDAAHWPRSALVHFLLTHAIEPHLGQNEITILRDYPPHEAALACVIEKNNELVAERFEAYHQGVELSNGYHELADESELRRRFTEENQIRMNEGKPAYHLDEAFLSALGPQFPDCCGVSVGVDRLLLLHHKAQALSQVLPFAWI